MSVIPSCQKGTAVPSVIEMLFTCLWLLILYTAIHMHMHCASQDKVSLRNIGVCAASVTWRRGAQGRRHAGQPLCNKCGVWEFRHPDSPPRDFIDEVSTSTSYWTDAAAVGSDMLQVGEKTCMVCLRSVLISAFHHFMFLECHFTFHMFSARLAFPSLTALPCCIVVSTSTVACKRAVCFARKVSK